MTLEEKIINGIKLDEYGVREAFDDFPCLLQEEDRGLL